MLGLGVGFSDQHGLPLPIKSATSEITETIAPAFFKRRIALARKLSHQLSQGIEIVGGSIDRHDDIESDSRSAVLLSTLI
jgi:hypothetical protein